MTIRYAQRLLLIVGGGMLVATLALALGLDPDGTAYRVLINMVFYTVGFFWASSQ